MGIRSTASKLAEALKNRISGRSKQLTSGKVDEKKAKRIITQIMSGGSVKVNGEEYNDVFKFMDERTFQMDRPNLLKVITNEIKIGYEIAWQHIEKMPYCFDNKESRIPQPIRKTLFDLLERCESDTDRLEIICSFPERTQDAIKKDPELLVSFNDLSFIVDATCEQWDPYGRNEGQDPNGNVETVYLASLANKEGVNSLENAMNKIFLDNDKAKNYVITLFERKNAVPQCALPAIAHAMQLHPEVISPEKFCELVKENYRDENGNEKIRKYGYIKDYMEAIILANYGDEKGKIHEKNRESILETCAKINAILDQKPDISWIRHISVVNDKGMLREMLIPPSYFFGYAEKSIDNGDNSSKAESKISLKDIYSAYPGDIYSFNIQTLNDSDQQKLLEILAPNVWMLEQSDLASLTANRGFGDIDHEIEVYFGIKRSDEMYEHLLDKCTSTNDAIFDMGFDSIAGDVEIKRTLAKAGKRPDPNEPITSNNYSYFKARYFQKLFETGAFEQKGYGLSKEQEEQLKTFANEVVVALDTEAQQQNEHKKGQEAPQQ